MRITLIQNEIEVALKEYVANQGISISNKEIEIDITAGRGANGITASLDIVEVAKKNPSVEVVNRGRFQEPEPKEDISDSTEEEEVVDEEETDVTYNEAATSKSLFAS